MRRRNRLAWKLSVPVLAVVTVAILGAGLVGSILSRRVALNAARNIMEFNSSSIRHGIEELMAAGERTRALGFIEEMAQDGLTYDDISLASHPSGRVAVSRSREAGSFLGRDNRSCNVCHDGDKPPANTVEMRGEVVIGIHGGRALRVITPIFSQPRCRNADCHAHAEAGTVIGLLTTEYSLARFDEMMTGLNLLLVLAAVLSMALTVTALLMMFHAILAQPLRRLITGLSTLAGGDLGFRFPVLRGDEIGLVEDSFNNMAAQIESHQTELQSAKEYLEGIVENTADVVVTVNKAGSIETFNRGAEKTLGYRRWEVIGKSVERLFADPHDRDTAIALLREQESVTNWETQFRTQDGEIRDVLLTLSRLRDPNGNVIGHLGIAKDVTTETELQKKLIQSEQAAAIGRAITAIQHAVKNMLNTLRGGLYVARAGLKGDDKVRVGEGCEMIEEGLERISDLSLNMLKYAREWKIEAEPVDLIALVNKIMIAVGQTANERAIEIRTQLDRSMPDVNCDPHLMHMALMDIVSNAMDACQAKDYGAQETPEIIVRAFRSGFGANLVIEIQDNGIGMTKEVMDNVFTPFFSTKKKWGTGLGLALTARLIDLHNGEISVESEPGRGSTFRLTLPLDHRRRTRR